MKSDDDFAKKYLSGNELYGDDIDGDLLIKWFEDEKEGYASLGAENKCSYKYAYHALNIIDAFDILPENAFDKALGLGSAYGDEFIPIADRIKEITVLEPSEAFISHRIQSVPVKYVKPQISGIMPFNDGEFDLATCFGVLHHIPNVSRVLSEIYRCLNKGGYLLLREPIISMGDWRRTRKGLTKNERGIPLELFRSLIKRTGFNIMSEKLCVFSLTSRLSKIFFKKLPYNSKMMVKLDRLLCGIFKANYSYHAHNWLKKIRPMSVFYVLQK